MKQTGKDPLAIEFGRRGGKARARKLSPERRREIARKASLARWKNHPKNNSKKA